MKQDSQDRVRSNLISLRVATYRETVQWRTRSAVTRTHSHLTPEPTRTLCHGLMAEHALEQAALPRLRGPSRSCAETLGSFPANSPTRKGNIRLRPTTTVKQRLTARFVESEFRPILQSTCRAISCRRLAKQPGAVHVSTFSPRAIRVPGGQLSSARSARPQFQTPSPRRAVNNPRWPPRAFLAAARA